MKRSSAVAVALLFLSGCLSGTGVLTDQRCVVSFAEKTPSSTLEVTQVLETDGTLKVFYETNRTVATVELFASNRTRQSNSTVPPGSHVLALPTDQLEDGTVTLRASAPDEKTVAAYRIITTGCTSGQ